MYRRSKVSPAFAVFFIVFNLNISIFPDQYLFVDKSVTSVFQFPSHVFVKLTDVSPDSPFSSEPQKYRLVFPVLFVLYINFAYLYSELKARVPRVPIKNGSSLPSEFVNS